MFSVADWPKMDVVPPTGSCFVALFLSFSLIHLSFSSLIDSEEVQEWMKELEGFDIPDLGENDQRIMLVETPHSRRTRQIVDGGHAVVLLGPRTLLSVRISSPGA